MILWEGCTQKCNKGVNSWINITPIQTYDVKYVNIKHNINITLCKFKITGSSGAIKTFFSTCAGEILL